MHNFLCSLLLIISDNYSNKNSTMINATGLNQQNNNNSNANPAFDTNSFASDNQAYPNNFSTPSQQSFSQTDTPDENKNFGFEQNRINPLPNNTFSNQSVSFNNQNDEPIITQTKTEGFPSELKKKNNLKVVAGSVLLFLLFIGFGAGFYLTQTTNTDLRQQAYVDNRLPATTGETTTEIGRTIEYINEEIIDIGIADLGTPPEIISARCSSVANSTNPFDISWTCWGGQSFQSARPENNSPWKIAAWHCPRPNTSDPRNPKTCNYNDPGAVRVYMTDITSLNYSEGKRDGVGGDGSICDISDPNQDHCIYYNVTSSNFSSDAYNNCGIIQADVFGKVAENRGSDWGFGDGNKYQALGAYLFDYGNYDNCDSITPTPTPPLVGPACNNISITDLQGNDLPTNADSSFIPGETSVKFKCGSTKPEDVHHYHFTITTPSGETITLDSNEGGGNISNQSLLISESGEYQARCQVCTTADFCIENEPQSQL